MQAGEAKRTTPKTKTWITVKDASERLEVTQKTVQNLAYAGELEWERCGGTDARARIHITLESVEAYKRRKPAREQNTEMSVNSVKLS